MVGKSTPRRRLAWLSLVAATLGVAATFSGSAWSQDGRPPVDYQGEKPRYLYHWTDQKGLAEFAETMKDGKPELKPLRKGVGVSYIFTEMLGAKGIFTWTHPVGGMASSRKEIYGGNSPALMEFEIKESAKILNLQSHGGSQTNLKGVDISKYDIAFFERRNKKGKRMFSEFIILNSSAIKRVTADPAELHPKVKPFYQRLRNRVYRLPAEDMHWGSGNSPIRTIFRKPFLDRLKKYLSLKPEDVPAKLRPAGRPQEATQKPRSALSNACSAFASAVGL